MFAQDKKSTPQVILHFWNQGIRSPLEIHKKTNIPIRTIKYNVKKIKDTGSVARKQGSSRPKKITDNHKRIRIEWAYAHLNDNWQKTLFTDETAFQLFRNTID